MNIGLILQILVQLLPIISQLFKLLIKSPEEKRRDMIKKIHSAIVNARENPGDTKDLENIIRG